MILEEKKITLKDGRTAVLKSPCVEDAEKMLEYIKKASGETDFLTRYPEEWEIDVEQEKKWIESLRSSNDNMGIACYVDGDLAGHCDIRYKTNMKDGHRAVLGIALLKEYWNLGIGSAMFSELIAEAEKYDIEILELQFVEGNDRAKHLYEKFGFTIVAELPNAFKLRDGTYLSEIFMQKYLPRFYQKNEEYRTSYL